ncbi:DNA polymerase III subunit gamma and tau [Cellulomonas gilvus]|uniref:DNA polymerase III subunit gamma and tau n=1 Tax=Cellulomonas gilvus TaxID=11 RepID=UPI000306BCF4|nr:DNA polymerase III subunit gamma and tau [Cellulomonas gilvus]
MTTALYRRYRPETFAEVIGQDHVTAPLRQALRTGQVNHAYLFSGPRGCGKTTSARILARILNCAQNTEASPTDTPCGVCPSCVELARGGPGSLDVVEIDAASHGGVDDARELRERATFAPARDRFKIFILDEAHMVTPQGFNALLKIVEEPPPHVKFVFATTEPDKVIGTIRSRTHHYPFRLVPPDVLLPYLEQLCDAESVPVGGGVLPLVVRAGGGSVRDTLSVLDQLIAGSDEAGLEYAGAAALLGYTQSSLLDDLVDAIAARDGAAAFRVVERVISTGHEPRRFVEDLLERLRDLIVIDAAGDAAGAALRGLPEDQLASMRVQSARLGATELSRSADLANAALTEMTGATSPRLHLELLMARLLLPAADDASTGLAARLDRLERGLPAGPAPVAAPAAASPATAATPAPERPSLGGVSGAAAARAALAAHRSGGSASSPASPDAARPAPRDDAGASAAGPLAAPAPAEPVASVPAASAPAVAAVPAGPAPTTSAPVPAEPAPAEPEPAPAEPAPAPAEAADSEPVVGGPAPTGAARVVASDEPGGPDRTTDEQTTADAGAILPADPALADPAVVGGEVAVPEAARAALDAPVEDAPFVPAPSGVSGETETLRRRWPEVLDTVRSLRRVTGALVDPNNAQVAELDATTLRLAFTTPELANTFRNGPHADVVARAVRETLGFDVRVEASAGEGGGGPAGHGSAGRAPSQRPAAPRSGSGPEVRAPSSRPGAPSGRPAATRSSDDDDQEGHRRATSSAPSAPAPGAAPGGEAQADPDGWVPGEEPEDPWATPAPTERHAPAGRPSSTATDGPDRPARPQEAPRAAPAAPAAPAARAVPSVPGVISPADAAASWGDPAPATAAPSRPAADVEPPAHDEPKDAPAPEAPSSHGAGPDVTEQRRVPAPTTPAAAPAERVRPPVPSGPESAFARAQRLAAAAAAAPRPEPAAAPSGPPPDLYDDLSPDDPDVASSGLVGAPLVAQILGGTVIDEQIDDGRV